MVPLIQVDRSLCYRGENRTQFVWFFDDACVNHVDNMGWGGEGVLTFM